MFNRIGRQLSARSHPAPASIPRSPEWGVDGQTSYQATSCPCRPFPESRFTAPIPQAEADIVGKRWATREARRPAISLSSNDGHGSELFLT
jgi:hypothetical protein